ncbi:MAG: hypothetical protein NC117_07330 [Pseudoflavonifractor sp.]|nr:hypothetical protein [Pseudoflavonifractor sp.]
MEKRLITGAISLLLFGAGAFGQEAETITYYDSFTDYGIAQNSVMPILDKEDRLNSNAGKIHANLVSVPDSVKTCVAAAIDIWESKIDYAANIEICVKFKELEADMDIQIDVSYTNESPIRRPWSLYKYQTGQSSSKATSSDAEIVINKSKSWDCSNGINTVPGSRNLHTRCCAQ